MKKYLRLPVALGNGPSMSVSQLPKGKRLRMGVDGVVSVLCMGENLCTYHIFVLSSWCLSQEWPIVLGRDGDDYDRASPNMRAANSFMDLFEYFNPYFGRYTVQQQTGVRMLVQYPLIQDKPFCTLFQAFNFLDIRRKGAICQACPNKVHPSGASVKLKDLPGLNTLLH